MTWVVTVPVEALRVYPLHEVKDLRLQGGHGQLARHALGLCLEEKNGRAAQY